MINPGCKAKPGSPPIGYPDWLDLDQETPTAAVFLKDPNQCKQDWNAWQSASGKNQRKQRKK